PTQCTPAAMRVPGGEWCVAVLRANHCRRSVMLLRPTTLVFSLAAALVVAISVLLTLRRGDAAMRPEPARFSGSRVVQRMPSLLAEARLPARVVVDVLRDDAAAS